MKVFIDNDIQIIRTLYLVWNDKSKKIFSGKNIISSDYALLEYKRTVIECFKILIGLVDHDLNWDSEAVNKRLSRITESLSSTPPFYITERQRKLTLCLLTFLLSKRYDYLVDLDSNKFIESMSYWAEELENVDFFEYLQDGKIIDIRDNDNYKIFFDCECVAQKNLKNCSKAKNTCKLPIHIKSEAFKRIMETIADKSNNFYKKELNILNKIWNDKTKKGSIGNICFKISDICHTLFCLHESSALISSDKEFTELIHALGQKAYRYDRKTNVFTVIN